jgi:hypothetical protein
MRQLLAKLCLGDELPFADAADQGVHIQRQEVL